MTVLATIKMKENDQNQLLDNLDFWRSTLAHLQCTTLILLHLNFASTLIPRNYAPRYNAVFRITISRQFGHLARHSWGNGAQLRHSWGTVRAQN